MGRRGVGVLAAALFAVVAGAAAGAPNGAVAGPLVVAVRMPDQGFQVGAVRGREVTFATGFEIELVRALAVRLGARDVRFVNVPRLERRLTARTSWGLAVARLRPQRSAGITFTEPYLRADQAILARRGLRRPRSLADLALLQLCALRGSRAADVIAGRVIPTTRHLAARDETELLGWVETGRCDAAVHEAPLLAVALRVHAPRVGKVVGRIETGAGYAVALPRGSDLGWRVNDALSVFRANGTVRRLAVRWLGFDPERLPVLR